MVNIFIELRLGGIQLGQFAGLLLKFLILSDDLTGPCLVHELVDIILLFPEVLVLVIFCFLNLFLR